MPNISILIPYYNDECYLKDSIQSVLNQTYKDFELVLINHACTDSSRKIAHSFGDSRIVHLDLPSNAGAGGGVILDAFLKIAKGNFIKLFCADDLLSENYLEKCLEYLKNNQNIDFCFTNEFYIDSKGKILASSFYEERTNHIVESDDWNFMALADYYHGVSNLPFSSCFFRKDCFTNVKIDFTIVMLFDMSIFLQMLLNDKNIGFIKEKLVSYRIHTGQISSSANLKKCMAQSFFEHVPFFSIFFETHNVCLLKRLLCRPDLSSIDVLRLELAKYFFTLPVITYQIVAYQYLHKYFQDEDHRNNENYTIAQFRNTYKYSELAYKCITPIENVQDIGIKRTVKILIKKIIKRILPKYSRRLTHL